VGGGDGGIAVNMSEGGLAIHSAVVLSKRPLPALRFQLPDSSTWVTATGNIAWTNESGKEAGIQFLDLPEQARKEIREWVGSSLYLSKSRAPSSSPALPVRSSNPPSNDDEGVDQELRARFAHHGAANGNPAAGQHTWWALVALVGLLAAFSFWLGWTEGHGKWSGLVDAFSAMRARVAPAANKGSANADASNLPAAASPATTAASRFTVASTLYIAVPYSQSREPSNEKSLLLGQIERRVDPVYPRQAVRESIEGTVKLHALINEDGTVHGVSVVSGPPLLAPAAADAVRSWLYAPTLLDGKPIRTEEDIAIVFSLRKTNQSKATR
jgi:TonB family protein